MDNIEGTEWLVLISMMINLLMAPGTKVEESFNVQATHDLIYNSYNLSNYDHNDFPGVVPRTFAGPLYLASFGIPLRIIMYLGTIPKFWMLFFIRFVLGATNVLAFLNFARCIRKHFGEEAATFLRIIVASQFHFIFYCSRPLPNTFALVFALVVYQRILDERYESAVRWATTATILFRCELVLLFGPMFIPIILSGKLPLFGFQGALFTGLKAALKALFITVPIDSLLWGKLTWPEAEVAWFNIFLNKSHEYGVQPFFWYFYSALPRALLASTFLIILGPLVDRRLVRILYPTLCFVLLYSFLPHKELRFIIYAFPMLNVSAAVFWARMYINRSKSWLRLFLYWGCLLHLFANIIATGVFIYTASRNYPGGDAIGHLQWTQRIDGNKPMTMYIDNACAQTGVNRFMQLYDTWEYNKTESLKPEDMERFDFLLIGTYGSNLKEMVMKNYTTWHRVMFAVSSFHRFSLKKTSGFPYYFPELQFKEKVAVLRKK
ncbi:unnamed protein product [Auanema sp. JU1783]|nr:unnamed protein product [Auanema sp. JU1783]